jgi:hypothetical protein
MVEMLSKQLLITHPFLDSSHTGGWQYFQVQRATTSIRINTVMTCWQLNNQVLIPVEGDSTGSLFQLIIKVDYPCT